MCKKCISCRNKIKRKTVKHDDQETKDFCINSGIDFDIICHESEEKKLKGRKSTSNTSISLDLLTSSPILPTNLISNEQIETLEQTTTKLTTDIKYLNDIMISRTEFNEMGVQEVRRGLEEKYQDQKGKYNLLLDEMEEFKTLVNNEYYSKDQTIQMLNQGFANFAKVNNLVVPIKK